MRTYATDASRQHATLEQQLAAAHAREAMYLQILDAVPDLVLCKGPQSRILYANKAFRDHYGMSMGDLRDMIDAPFAKPDNTQQYIKDDEQVFSTGETLDIPEEPVSRHDGEACFFHTRKSALRDERGGIIGTIGVSQDITELKQADEWLAQSLASSPLVTIEWDTNGIVRRWNLSAERVFGWSAEEALGKRVFELITPYIDEREYGSIIEQHLNGQIVNTRFDNVTKDGRTVACQWYNVVLRKAGRSIGMVAQAEDLTERLQAEQERLALQEQIIAAQDATLRELSTPLIPLGDNIVALPLVGGIDSLRAQQIIDSLLQGVAEQRAATAIIDITGVPVVDTQVANALIRAAQAVGLLGAQVVLTGIRPEVAQTLVGLGTELRGIVTRSTLQSGIAYALKR